MSLPPNSATLPVMKYVSLLLCAGLLIGCEDGSGPDELAAGRFAMQVRGPTNLNLEGDAQVFPGLGAGTIETVHLVSHESNVVYRLQINFVPFVNAPRGSFAVTANGAVQASFFIANLDTGQQLQMAVAQSGTLTLQECSLSRCAGAFTGQFPLGSSVQQSSITASFHARFE
jgi:hypothetical protein